MQLRDYQHEFVNESVNALLKYGNTLSVAPTGAGKTIMLASVVKRLLKLGKGVCKVCIIAHRNELTKQNSEKFLRVNPDINISIVNAETKDFSGQVVFAMVQSLSVDKTLEKIPSFDLIVVDETHHIAANSYKKIIEAVRAINPDVMLLGVTATPNRGDKLSLTDFFTNCAADIHIADLIEDGYLVEPKTYAIDVASEALKNVALTSNGDYNEKIVGDILNKIKINQSVVDNYLKYAAGRKAVVFCSTINHAKDCCKVFVSNGIRAKVVSSIITTKERRDILEELESGIIDVVINVAILTEGWDYPPISCVILLRQTTFKSTYIQMVGRGLRVVAPKVHPSFKKNDCIVLDFGLSTEIHQCLEQHAYLEQKKHNSPSIIGYGKECQRCKKIIPCRSRICMFCGFKEEAKQKYAVGGKEIFVTLKEYNLLKAAEVDWVNVGNSENPIYFCSGFNVWVSILQRDKKWYVVVGSNSSDKKAEGEKLFLEKSYEKALKRAEKLLKTYEARVGYSKDACWRQQNASPAQLEKLTKGYLHSKFGYSKKMINDLKKGEASSLLAFKFRAKYIDNYISAAE